THTYLFKDLFETFHFSFISKHYFKYLLFLSGLRELFLTDVCFQILRISKGNGKIILENTANECKKLKIKFRSSLTQ
ncbi:unnamed protein product, partial [Hymenolepis diminuta]